jgi:hypothetical protein
MVDELVYLGRLWPRLQSPLVRLAFEQTVRRLGGQVKIHSDPNPVGDWGTDLELTVVHDFLVARLPCGDAEVVVDLGLAPRLVRLYDLYSEHLPSPSPEPRRRRYEVIWNFTRESEEVDITTITATALDDPLTTRVIDRDFQFVGYPWWDTVVNAIIYRYERLIISHDHAFHSTAPVRLVLADVKSPTRDGEDTILFPKDVVAGYWARQFALMAAALAINI